MYRDVVIVSGVRTPIGSFLGSLQSFKAQTLGAIAMKEATRRAGLDYSQVDQVIMGNIIQTDPRGNPAREALLEADFSFKIPGYTVNKNCGSGLKSVNIAAAMIKSGEVDVIVAGGMESMSQCPYVLRSVRSGYRMGHSNMVDLLTDLLEGMGLTAEKIATLYNITREDQDQFAYNSQMKATKAQVEGKFKNEILPIEIIDKGGNSKIFTLDEGIKSDTTLDGLASLHPVFKTNGSVTPGNSSTINDAAALVLMTAEKAKQLRVKPLAKIRAWASAGCDPTIMGIGPVPATKLALKNAGMKVKDIDLIELNEAFAAQALAVIKELNLDTDIVNVNGGAIALGHPVGASGSIVLIKLIHEMKRRGVNTGLATLCIGGGQGVSIIVENL